MRRLWWVLVLMALAAPALAAERMNVQQLKDALTSFGGLKKTDAEVAYELEQIELTEELTRSTIDSLANYIPGPLSTQQMFILEARSSVLAPPASDLPSLPAPDADAQKALLDKAAGYVSNEYAKLPALSATKTTYRFQDNPTAVVAMSSPHFGTPTQDPHVLAAPDMAPQIIRYIGATESPVASVHGVELAASKRDKTRWGENGQIALLGQGPVLGSIMQEAQTAGKVHWLRWETLNGRQAAVFSFEVDKKISRYAVNYCCFPDLGQVGKVSRSGNFGAVGSSGNTGNMQTTLDWTNFKATVPYHGEFFVDRDTGIVVRLVTQADFKSTDTVQQEAQRIDYSAVTIGEKPMVLPVRCIVATEVVPNGTSGAGKYSTRHTLFTIEYKDYQLAAGTK